MTIAYTEHMPPSVRLALQMLCALQLYDRVNVCKGWHNICELAQGVVCSDLCSALDQEFDHTQLCLLVDLQVTSHHAGT